MLFSAISYLGMTVQIMIQVYGKIRDTSINGEFPDVPGRVEIVITHNWLRFRLHADSGSLWQLDLTRQDDNAVFDCALIAHSSFNSTTQERVLANPQLAASTKGE
jgi:hypothetical protein